MPLSRLGLVLALVLASCARIEPPPGGPPDTAPPRLIGEYPESLASLPGFDGNVEFRFDEVVSEGSTPSTGSGTGDLERLVILSPSNRVPDVSWKRSRITVRPAEGWQPGRFYRVELLPGVVDLRNNRSTSARAVVAFTTGGPLPVDTLRGRIVDWTTGQPVPRGLIEAILLPDSLPYRFRSDSAGTFVVTPLPSGRYVIYGAIDQNNNSRRDLREAYDSASAASNGPVITLWTFPHDTNPPRIQQATPRDSQAVDLQFSQPLDPDQRLDTSRAVVRHLPDSARVGVSLLTTSAAYDSIRQAARTDSAAPGIAPAVAPAVAPRVGDTLKRRPTLSNRLVLVLAAPMDTAGQYLLTIDSVRNVTGVAATVHGVFSAPKPLPARLAEPLKEDSLPADSARVQPDSAGTRPVQPPRR